MLKKSKATGRLVISEEMRMQVIAEEPWNWILLEEGDKRYLDILVEHGAMSFNVTFELNPEQAAQHVREGIRYVNELSSAMRNQAVMREWSALPPALPPDCADRVSRAIREWRNPDSHHSNG